MKPQGNPEEAPRKPTVGPQEAPRKPPGSPQEAPIVLYLMNALLGSPKALFSSEKPEIPTCYSPRKPTGSPPSYGGFFWASWGLLTVTVIMFLHSI